MLSFQQQAHWRDSARSIKFFLWDGKIIFPIVIFLLHIRLWTLIFAVVAIIFFSILNRYGFTPIVFIRWLRGFIAGPRKISMPWWLH